MPIKDFIEKFEYDPDTFDPVQFKADMIAEFMHDENAWTAAVKTRDETNTKTAAELQKAQAKAWELLQQLPAGQDAKQQGTKPDEDPTDVAFEDIFTTEDRK